MSHTTRQRVPRPRQVERRLADVTRHTPPRHVTTSGAIVARPEAIEHPRATRQSRGSAAIPTSKDHPSTNAPMHRCAGFVASLVTLPSIARPFARFAAR